MDERRELWRLRREVICHPARPAAGPSPGEPTRLEHRAFAEWASCRLAEDLGLRGARRHLARTETALWAQGAGNRPAYFLDAVAGGVEPALAMSQAGAPPAVGDLVAAVAQIAGSGSDARRLGAFGLGLPCCRAHQAPVLERLATAIAADPTGRAEAEANAAALVALRAHLALLDADLETLRRRGMAMHPSALCRSSHHPAAQVPTPQVPAGVVPAAHHPTAEGSAELAVAALPAAQAPGSPFPGTKISGTELRATDRPDRIRLLPAG